MSSGGSADGELSTSVSVNDAPMDWEARAKELETYVMELQEQAEIAKRTHENEIADLKDTYGVTELESQTRIEELEHELDLSKETVRKLELEEAGYIVLQEENERLSKLLIDLQDQMSTLVAEHTNEANSIKRESFNARVNLEHTFRKTLQELEKKLHQRAFAEMDKESKSALVEKARVQDELALQTIGIEALTKRYNEKCAIVQTLRTDKTILQEHQSAQTKRISTLKQQLGKLESLRVEHEEALVAAQAKAMDADSLRTRVKELETQVSQQVNAYEAARTKAETLEKKLLHTSEKLKALELSRKKGGKKVLPSIGPNDALLKTLASFGKPSYSTLEQTNRSVMKEENETDAEVYRGAPRDLGGGLLEPSSVTLASASLQNNHSMPSLRKSEYTGILETWNAKFNQKRPYY